jgi:hypothetical protein
VALSYVIISEKAHKEFHAKHGKQNNTIEQLKEFLGNNNYAPKGI